MVIIQTSQVHFPLDFVRNLANKSSGGFGSDVGAAGTEAAGAFTNFAKMSSTGAVPSTFPSSGGASGSAVFSSVLVSCWLREPNTGAAEDPLLAGAERKEKASEAETELVEEKPPKLLKIFFF